MQRSTNVVTLCSDSRSAVSDFWEALGEYLPNITIFQLIVDTSNFLLVANSASNFLVYTKRNDSIKRRKETVGEKVC